MLIYKYELDPNHLGNETTIGLPMGAQVLSFGQQNDVPVLWALVDPLNRITRKRRFLLAFTGKDLPKDLVRFIGTVQMPHTGIVVHLWELE